MGHVHNYDDFVTWRDAHHDVDVTVGDAMRHFTATTIETILVWWKRDEAEQEAASASLTVRR